jgi:hypothetical protein
MTGHLSILLGVVVDGVGVLAARPVASGEQGAVMSASKGTIVPVGPIRVPIQPIGKA